VEHETKGIVKYTDGSLEVGQVVGFEPFSKYEFIIDGEKLYRVYSKYITIKYEYQGNEETYNPSWAQSG
jgi:urate oxidase